MATVSALFVGNSFTARNNVPGLISAMAKERGHALAPRLISRGGASLKMHFSKGDAVKAIESGDFDTVVLQEQSTLPVKNPARFHENVRLFDPVTRAARGPSGKPVRLVLYLTWARRHSPQHQALLTDAYTSIGRELKATVAPAGVAWQKVLKDHPEITLHDKDDSHPTLAGSYLAACVLFATIFDESPVGCAAPAGLSLAEAKALQKGAWSVMGK